MNKKFLSFVLAMCLGFCFGVVNASYEGEGSSRMDQSISQLGSYTVNMSSSTSMSSVPKGLQPYVKTLIKFIGGISVGGANADGSFDVYRYGKAFMSYKLKESEDGTQAKGWKVANIAADYDTLKALGFDVSKYYNDDGSLKSGISKETVAKKLAAALAPYGVTEQDFYADKTDSSGNLKTDSAGNKIKGVVDWLNEGLSSLLKGSNYSIQIDFTGSGGSTCAFIQNGQLQYTLNASGLCVAENHYTKDGFIDYSDELTFDVVNTNTGTANTKYKAVKKRSYYNDFGNVESTYEMKSDGSRGKLVTTYEYSNPNGSGYLKSQTDVSTGNKTVYRADGKVDHTTNAKDGTSSTYVYRSNGTLEKIQNMGKNGAITSTRIFSRAGQDLGITTKSIPGSYADAADYYYAMVREAKSKGNDTGAIYDTLDKYGFTGKGSISVYDYMLNDSSYNSFLNTIGVNATRRAELRASSNGYSANANVSNIARGAAKNTQTSKDYDVHSGKFKSYKTTTTDSAGDAITSEITMNSKGAAYRVDNGYCQISAAKVTVTTHVDPVVVGKLWSADPTDEELKAAMEERGIDENDEDAIAELKAELADKKLKAKAKELGVDTSDEKAMEDLKNGFYTGSDGQTYAIVDADSINMMAGNGFQAAKGETVLVGIDDDMKQQIMNGIGEDRRIMFKGDVSESAAGNIMTIIANKNYGNGVTMGDAIDEEITNIFLISLGTAMQSGQVDIRAISAALEDYNKENGTNFTTQDAKNAYDKAGADYQWVKDNTMENINKGLTNIKDIRKAYEELLNIKKTLQMIF